MKLNVALIVSEKKPLIIRTARKMVSWKK